MPIKVEAAVVTQKRPEAAFNSDSININGKVFPREIIKNGYKGSGIISGNSYFVLTSSEVDGFADATVAAFNDRAGILEVARDARNVFSGFYEDCRSALLNMNRGENELASVCLYASGRRVVLATNRDSSLYSYRLGICVPVSTAKAQETVADYNNTVFSDVAEGDIFILVSPGVTEVLTEKDIEDICKVSDGSVKKIVSLILKVCLAKGGKGAISAFAVKILETAVEPELNKLGFAPVFAEKEAASVQTAQESCVQAETAQESAAAEPASEVIADAAAETVTEEKPVTEEISEETAACEAVNEENTDEKTVEVSAEKTLDPDSVFPAADETASDKTDAIAAAIAESAQAQYAEMLTEDETAAEVTDEAASEEEAEEKSKGTRVKLFIALAAFVAISVMLFVVIFFVKGIGNKENDGDEVNGTQESNATEEYDGTASQDSVTTPSSEDAPSEAESETEAEEPSAELSTDEEEAEERVTETPSEATSASTTAAPETTAASEENTSAEEETTAAEEETTAAEEETIAAEEETTASQEETTAAEEETTAAQEETTASQEETAASEENAGENTENGEETPAE